MVRRSLSLLTLAILAWGGVPPVAADPIKFTTGNVEQDFNPLTNPNVIVVVDSPNTIGQSDPNDVFNANRPTGYSALEIQNYYTKGTPLDRVSGWNIKDLRLAYDSASDTMAVGVNFFGIAGDADGNGNPGVYSSPYAAGDPRAASDRGSDFPKLGGNESVTVGFDLNRDGRSDVVAGIPSNKAQAGPGLDGFNVARYQVGPNGRILGDHASYGPTLTDNLGILAFDPSAAHPGFEFTIRNFSTLGVDFRNGFNLRAYSGNNLDLTFGEDNMVAGFPIIIPQVIPEPSTILGWGLLALGAGWQVRRHRRGRRQD